MSHIRSGCRRTGARRRRQRERHQARQAHRLASLAVGLGAGATAEYGTGRITFTRPGNSRTTRGELRRWLVGLWQTTWPREPLVPGAATLATAMLAAAAVEVAG